MMFVADSSIGYEPSRDWTRIKVVQAFSQALTSFALVLPIFSWKLSTWKPRGMRSMAGLRSLNLRPMCFTVDFLSAWLQCSLALPAFFVPFSVARTVAGPPHFPILLPTANARTLRHENVDWTQKQLEREIRRLESVVLLGR